MPITKILGDYWDSENEVWVNEKTRATSRFVQKRNELDFASLTAYYDFKREWIQKIGLERLKLSFYMNDICKFSSIKWKEDLDIPFCPSRCHLPCRLLSDFVAPN